LEEAAWRIPIHDHEVAPGSLSKLPRRATREVSRRRYLKFLRLIGFIEAMENFQKSFDHRDGRTFFWLIRIWPSRVFLLLNFVFLLENFMISRVRLLYRCHWWARSTCLSVWTWISSGGARKSALRDLREEMAMEWDTVVNDTPDLYLLPVGMNYSMKLFITEQGYIGIGPAILEKQDVVCIFGGAKAPHILRRRPLDEVEDIGLLARLMCMESWTGSYLWTRTKKPDLSNYFNFGSCHGRGIF
jgi:hypothetical protein